MIIFDFYAEYLWLMIMRKTKSLLSCQDFLNFLERIGYLADVELAFAERASLGDGLPNREALLVEIFPAGHAVVDFLDNFHLAEANRAILLLNFVSCLNLQLSTLSVVAHPRPQVAEKGLVEPLVRGRKDHLRGLKLIDQLVILGDLIDYKGQVTAYLPVGAVVNAVALQDS